MSEKVFNHEVTAGLLRGWLGRDAKSRQGIWYWNLHEGVDAPSFEEGKKANFAGHDFLYVGNKSGEPITTVMEDMLAKHESSLVKLAQALWEKRATQSSVDKWAPLALTAILTGAFRSNWSISKIGALLALDEQARMHYIADQFRATLLLYRGWEFDFFQDTAAPLLICDAPFFDMRIRQDSLEDQVGDVCMMPLGPHAYMMGSRSARPISNRPILAPTLGEPLDLASWGITVKLARQSVPERLVELTNKFTLHRARGWIVAATEKQLLDHQKFLQPTELAKRVALDTAVVQDGNGRILARLDDIEPVEPSH